MEYILHIQPTFDCLIKTNNIEIELVKHKIYSFLCKQNIITLSFYPINNQINELPFSYTFVCSNIKPIKNVTVTSYPNNNYLLSVSPFFFLTPNPINLNLKKIELGKESHKIYYLTHSQFSIKLENENNFMTSEYPIKILDLNTKTKDNFLFIYCKTDSNTYLVLLIEYQNKNYKIIKQEEVEQLEIETNKIKTYKNMFDFAGHGEISTYDFSSDFTYETSLVYSGDAPIFQLNKELIPYAFFDAIKINNYKLARTYLTKELSNNLTNKSIKNYFGNFIEITSVLSNTTTLNEVALIYNKDYNVNTARIFNVEMNEQNKISNITEQ